MNSIRVFGLTRLETLDLKKEFPEAEITFEDKPTSDPEHGELVTAAVIAGSIIGIRALSAWLLKNRRSGTIEKVVEVTAPDGTQRTEKIKLTVSESTTNADVVEALAKLLDVDLKDVVTPSK